jgi:diaminopimelate epimerase
MDIDFTKMHGAGNDFMLIDDMDERCRLSTVAIAALCSRTRGIGADGLILVRPAVDADFAMRYFNCDGGEADLCGNGARCAAAFAYARGIAGREMTFSTRAGAVRGEILEDGVRIAVADVEALALGMNIESSPLPVHFGVCGVPHAVIVDEAMRRASRDDFERFASTVRRDRAFGASGANVNVVSVLGANRCAYRTYERGIEGETLACGTGSVVIAAILTHLVGATPPIICETSGGDVLEVECAKTPAGATNCRLKGPVAAPFRGSFRAEDFDRP